MAKRLVDIGDKFGTWEVIGLEENDKKYNYNYICRCDCSNTRIIRKDKLVNFTYPKCDKCLSNGTIDRKWELIKSRWNSKINGALVYSQLQLKKHYTWNCPIGHIYRESIFMLDEECPKCREERFKEKKQKNRNIMFNSIIDFLDDVCSELWEDVDIKIDEELFIIWLEVNGFIVLMTPSIHNVYDEVIHETKSEYLDILSRIVGYKNMAKADTREHIFLDLNLNKKDFEKIKSVLGIVNSK